MRIAVFGAGALGSVFGAILSRKNEVLLITRGEHLRAIKERGLKVEGHTKGIFHLPAENHYPGGYELIILTVKAYQIKDVVNDIRKEYDGEPIITFQNGVGIVDLLKNFDVIPGVTTHGATLLSPGVVKHAGIGDTYIGEKKGEISERIVHIARNFTECGLKTEIVNDIMERRWIKAAINACINPLTAVLNVKNGELLDENLSKIVKCVADECSEILGEMGIITDIYSLAMDVIRKTKENNSSMLQDINRRRKTEIDFIVKPFIKKRCNKVLYHMVKFLESRLRDSL